MNKIDVVFVYRCILVGIILAVLGFGAWYISENVGEQRSIKDGTLVLQEEGSYAANGIY